MKIFCNNDSKIKNKTLITRAMQTDRACETQAEFLVQIRHLFHLEVSQRRHGLPGSSSGTLSLRNSYVDAFTGTNAV